MAFQFGSYSESDKVKKAWEEYQALAGQRPSPYASQYTQQIGDTVSAIENHKPFSYDVNGDALYQMYKNQYIGAGRQAMADTMGKAASMTGGYGNSYAATAGNQAYQAYLGKLNEVLPQTYQMAYSRYSQEGQDLLNRLSMYQTLDQTDYGRYRDTVGDWQTDRSYLYDVANNERNWDYGLWGDEEERRYKNYQLAMAEAAAAAGGGSGRRSSRGTSKAQQTVASFGDAFKRAATVIGNITGSLKEGAPSVVSAQGDQANFEYYVDPVTGEVKHRHK